MTGDGGGPGIVHRCEAAFKAMANAFPDSVFGRNEVGEPFADTGEAGERGNVCDGGAEKNLSKDFRGDVSYRTGRSW